MSVSFASVCMQVLVLLKSSDRVLHDMTQAFDSCTRAPDKPPQLQLALRRFVDMRPESEFRCFIHEHSLVGKRMVS